MNTRVEIVEENAVPWVPGPDYFRQIPGILWSRRILIAAVCVGSLLAGVVALLAIEPRYTASAVLRFDFAAQPGFSRIEQVANSSNTAISIDASREVETFARLLMTDAIARRVVNRLGREKLFDKRSRLSKWLDTRLPVAQRPIDRATEELRRGLTVASDFRSYLITVSYTTAHPAEAAELANTFLSEALRTQIVSRFKNDVAAAQRTVESLAFTFGDEHPTMLRAKDNLSGAKQRMESQQREIDAWTVEQLAAVGNVAPAVVNTVPAYPKPRIVVLVSLVVGLALGILIALFVHWRKSWGAI